VKLPVQIQGTSATAAAAANAVATSICVYIWRNASYKLLERVVLQRISPDSEDILNKDQAGFTPAQGAA